MSGTALDVVSFALNHGDDNLVLAQRLGELISRGPDLEEDIAIANLALDHLGQARALYTLAAGGDGAGRSEDDLAFTRTEREFTNLLLVEQPNGDFAQTMARELFFDSFQALLWERVADEAGGELSGIAGRALKETRYHVQHASSWVIRLGDGTDESHQRMQAAVDRLWRFTSEMFEDESEHARWRAGIDAVLAEATLAVPADDFQRSGGRTGNHTEHLGHLLAEMQWMQRAYPGLVW